MSRISIESKAAEIYAHGQVGRPFNAEIYPVKQYRVILPPSLSYELPSCNCQATVPCKHIKAAELARYHRNHGARTHADEEESCQQQ